MVHVIEYDLPAAEASAGEARRLALSHAEALAGNGIILTTDADGAVPPCWAERNLAAINAGAEVVCGRAEVKLEDAMAIPTSLHDAHLREMACLTLLDEIEAIVDPDPHDPWPRHRERSGASIAFTAAAFRRAGGAPAVPQSEDRVLIARLALVDARIRHAPDIAVTVSGRLEGRAAGGMADTIKRRLTTPDVLADETLEPAVDAYRRALAKARLRRLWQGDAEDGDAATMAADLLIPEPAMAALLSAPFFGAAWDELQRQSPILRRRRLAVADLPRETRQALALRDDLLAGAASGPAEGRVNAG